MTPATLTKELIDDTSAMRLVLRLDAKNLSALIVGPESPGRFVLVHSCTLVDGSMKALENAVYDNPLLLGDFSAIDIILTTRNLFTAPECPDSLLDAMAEAMLPDYEAERVILRDGLVCFAVEADKFNFLTRTFACARFHHTLAITASALHQDGVFAVCQDDEMTLIRRSNGLTSYLNCPPVWSAADCAYYILAVTQTGDDVFLSADSDAMRERIVSLLTQVNPEVSILPLSSPDNLVKLRGDTGAPLDMVMLCE